MGQSINDSQDGTGRRGTSSSLRSPLMVDGAPSSSSQWRVLILFLLLFLSVGFSLVLRETSPHIDQPNTSFLHMWLLSFLPYFVACAFVVWTQPLQGYWLWAEVGLLFFGALLLRALLLPLPPNLSHDSWRYVWDARVLAHGYSPYVDAPGASIYLPLRNFIFDNSRFRDVPTIYLPVAQGVYLLSYLLAPNSLFTLKGIFLLCDLVTCGALSWLLARKGLDPRRMIIYAWCPLPIVEYALQGHVDPLTIMLTVLAVACATSTQHRVRVLAGVVIALAALTKIYPILLLAVVLRRRDGGLLLACALTMLVAYLPFLRHHPEFCVKRFLFKAERWKR